MRTLAFALAAAALCLASPSLAAEWRNGDKLLLTGGVSNVEGAGGGGIATWATTTGYGGADGFGGNVHATYAKLKDYELRSWGGAAAIYDRVEVSYARQSFDTGATGAKLGIGKGFTFHQDVVGAKLVVGGDAVYDQDRLLPQIAIGVQYKRNDRRALVGALGATDHEGIDYYAAATKLLLAQSLLVNGTVRMTKANQGGLLGFGGSNSDSYKPQFEGSIAWLANRRLALGVEYRTKPDNLAFAKESDWADAFVAYAFNKHLSVTAAYVDLGQIATFKQQRGVYLSLQTGF